MSERFKLAIVGAGPAGLSCATRAAEIGLSHVLLESEPHLANTVHRYQKRKHVMAEPGNLPLRSALPFRAGRREEVLAAWAEAVRRCNVNVRTGVQVVALRGAKGDFSIETAGGVRWHAEHVVLAIGLQGNLRRLGIPGEELAGVRYQLDDPDEHADQTIVVVGAGDAAIENALALAANNRIILVNRGEEFPRAKQGNLEAVLAAIREGRIEVHYNTVPQRIEAMDDGGKPMRLVVQTAQGSANLRCDLVIARLGATPPRRLVESFGVRFPSEAVEAVPQLSTTYESNVPGLYIVGALAGYPLIKQAINQGYEVAETIAGRAIEPADEPLLRAKLLGATGFATVEEALEVIRRDIPIFSGLTRLQLREFLLESEVHVPRPGDVVFRRGDYTNSFYSILAGEVRIAYSDKEGTERYRSIGRGEFFGEMGLISGRRRANTVFAGEHCVLVETPRRSMLKLVNSMESVRRLIDETSLRRAVQTQIAPGLAAEDLDAMVRGATIKRFAAGETLFREGDAPDGLHLVRRGSVTVSRTVGGREVVLRYVPAGNYVGEMALLSDAKRSATVRAAVTTETIVLQADRFAEVLGRNPQLRDSIQAHMLERLANNVKVETAPDSGSLVTFLVGHGLGEATDVLLIDESLCIRCDNCERACADTHGGTSRLDRQAGPTYANIHVPTSCRHCENPHCMKDCPPDAIQRHPDGEVFITDACIGCGNCERNCPYGVIQLASAQSGGAHRSLFGWLLFELGGEPGKKARRAGSRDEVKVAVKCDMCRDLAGGPACVRACPTGAAFRVSPEKFLDYAGSR